MKHLIRYTVLCLFILSCSNLLAGPQMSVEGPGGNITSPNDIADNAVVTGDGGAKGIQGSDVRLDGGDFTQVDSIRFTTAPQVHEEGSIHWNDIDKTLDIDTENPDTSIQSGQEIVVRATNKTGLTITNGQVVYVSGAQGSRPTIDLADADLEVPTGRTIGLATHEILDNATGYVTTFGLVRDVDTSASIAGSLMFVSSEAGEFVGAKPTYPRHEMRIGYNLFSNPSSGIVFVSTQKGQHFENLWEVNVGTQVDTELIVWDSANGQWKNIGSYVRHLQIPSGVAFLGPTAPSPVTYNSVVRCLEFDNDSEEAFVTLEIPDDWIGGEDLILEVDWLPNDSAMANGETVKFDLQLRTIAEDEDADGTLTSATATHTDSGGATVQGLITHTPIILDYDDADNPMVKQDHIYIEFTRDMSGDTYGGGACVTAWEFVYNSNTVPQI